MKKAIVTFLIFIFGLLFLLFALVASAVIPKNALQLNLLESAVFLKSNKMYFNLIPAQDSTKQDHYGDTILLSIAYYLDEDHPLESAMWSKYYYDKEHEPTENNYTAIVNGYPANQEYLRYWHGSLVPVRIMHLFWNVNQIYIFHAVLMAVLLIILTMQLLCQSFWKEAIAIIFSFLMVRIWAVPFSLEYTWAFLCMLFFSIICVRSPYSKHIGIYFMLCGMLTVYLDFLTTETLSLLIPLLLILRIRSIHHKEAALWKFIISSCLMWGIGYAGMWIMKWVIASLVLHQNVMPYVWGHIEERIGGNVYLQDRFHRHHHLGVISTFVIPVPSTMMFSPGFSTGKSPTVSTRFGFRFSAP